MDLTNKKYPKEVLGGLNELRKQAELTDVVLELEGESGASFPCHRAILALCSPYFHRMFTSSYAEAKQERICIQKVSEVAMATILDYAYTGCLQTESDQVQDVMSAARLLQVDFVYHKAAEYMKNHLDMSNCADILMYADMLGDLDLLETSRRFSQVVLQPSFLQLPLPLLQSLLNREDLRINSEDDVVQAALRWIEFDKEVRLQHLPALCKSFRHPFVSAKLCEELQSKSPSSDCQLVYSEKTTQRLEQTRTEMQIAVLREISVEFPVKTRCFDLARGTTYIMNMPDNLEGFTMISTAEDELYLAGGVYTGTDGVVMNRLKAIRNSQKKFYQYNHLLDTWEPKCEMMTTRFSCNLVCLDGYIYAIGDGRTNKSAERYDPSCDKWACIPPIPYPMPRTERHCLSSAFCAVALDDSIYVISEKGCYRFNTTENTWSKTADMLEPPLNPQAVAYQGCIYCVDTNDDTLTYVEKYNPEDGAWIHSDNAKTFSCTSLALMLHGDSLYLLTVHFPEDMPYNSHDLYKYQPDTDSWLKQESADIIVTPIKQWMQAHVIEDWLVARMIPTCLGDVSSEVLGQGESDSDDDEYDN
ncbi:PREDICTED: kelch repeat and BTB domain-containing protein 8-like isoform X2 [Branchiostoma belcheri]|uniref:Kelch repeat and BTB domain-containing protein 8-like isoform X2 n=1 Tax=Branchiostoma belcheri TaxID=7741 RepID=A0A6P4Z0W4_BRABE|nr:PREDICTED: kelch repeat and BTB domain-containing protein 8-like isoform X2 [Branchiostoma belcheri]